MIFGYFWDFFSGFEGVQPNAGLAKKKRANQDFCGVCVLCKQKCSKGEKEGDKRSPLCLCVSRLLFVCVRSIDCVVFHSHPHITRIALRDRHHSTDPSACSCVKITVGQLLKSCTYLVHVRLGVFAEHANSVTCTLTEWKPNLLHSTLMARLISTWIQIRCPMSNQSR